MIQNKQDSITYQYDLLDSTVKTKEDVRHSKAPQTGKKHGRFGKQESEPDQSALYHSLKIEKLKGAIAAEKGN